MDSGRRFLHGPGEGFQESSGHKARDERHPWVYHVIGGEMTCSNFKIKLYKQELL